MNEDLKNNEHLCKCGFEHESVKTNICMNCLAVRIQQEIEYCNPDLRADLQEKKYFRVWRIIEGKQV